MRLTLTRQALDWFEAYNVSFHNRFGTGSIVAANAVVTRDVPPYSIVGGNPARLIKARFEPALAAALAATQWWKYNWTDFCDLDIADPEAFVAQFGKRKRKLRVFRPRKIRLADVPA